jgi:hypothetical protein
VVWYSGAEKHDNLSVYDRILSRGRKLRRLLGAFVGQALMASAVSTQLSVARISQCLGSYESFENDPYRYPAQQLRRSVLVTTFDAATAEFWSSRLMGMLRFHTSIP